MAELRAKLDAEALRLQNTIDSGNPSAIKGARTRFENAHRAYWEAVHRAWAEITAGGSSPKKDDPQVIADKHGVLLQDIAEVAR